MTITILTLSVEECTISIKARGVCIIVRFESN